MGWLSDQKMENSRQKSISKCNRELSYNNRFFKSSKTTWCMQQEGSSQEIIFTVICQQIWKTQQWPQDQKRSVFTPIPKKGNAKECSNYHTIALISHANKVMLKILQDRLQQYMNCEPPYVQAGFRKGRGTRDQIANIRWIIKTGREFQKNLLLLLY